MDNKPKKSRIFRLSLMDAATHERLWSLRFTKPVFVAAIVASALVLIMIVYSLIAFTPIRTSIPGYPDARSRRVAVQNARAIDSLQTKVIQWELYTENLRRVIAGEPPISIDGMVLGSEGSAASVSDSVFLALRDSLLRADVSRKEQFEVSSTASRSLPIEAISFYSPIKGVVTNPVRKNIHPWVDVTAPSGSPVYAVLDGTVLFTAWDDAAGYTVVMQHRDDIVSVYKNNRQLLRKTGDKVKAGTPVGILASSSSLTKGDHLHFELWSSGEAVDPAEYISF